MLDFSFEASQENDLLESKILNDLTEILRENKNIAKYNFKNNYIADFVAMKMLKEVKENKNIYIIDLP